MATVQRATSTMDDEVHDDGNSMMCDDDDGDGATGYDDKEDVD